jgi:hypothetical protein
MASTENMEDPEELTADELPTTGCDVGISIPMFCFILIFTFIQMIDRPTPGIGLP